MDSNEISRRNLIKGGTLLAAASALGFGGMLGTRRVIAAEDQETVQQIIDVAATAELFATTHYNRAIAEAKKTGLSASEIPYLQAGLEQERFHYDYLVSLGAKPLAEQFYFPVGTFANKKALATVTSIAETVFVGAYTAAIHSFAALNQPQFAAIAGQVLTTEAQHLLFMMQLLGVNPPNNLPITSAPFYQVKDAVPVLLPVLDGKKGGLGEMEKDAVKPPTKEEIAKALGGKSFMKDKDVLGTPIAPFPASMPSMMAATMEPTKAK